MIGLIGKPRLYAKIEIASFSRSRYIIGIKEPQILGTSQAQGHAHFMLCVRIYDGPRKTQAVHQIWSR